jgi:CheY-like chemotaxis protein
LAPIKTHAFRVLAVDDESGIRELAARVLRQPGYEVSVAADAVEAIRIAETAGAFDLLVTDVKMPGIAGDELARRLRRATPDLKVLYLTGFGDRLFETRHILWDGEAFLDKPFTVPGLLEAVALLLVGRVPPPRAVRVRIPGARVRFDERLTTLDSLNINGGLIQVEAAVPVGTKWPLVLELPGKRLRVTARVVNCDRRDMPVSTGASPSSFSVAFAFVDLSKSARRVLEHVIREAPVPTT